jgi:tyrosyl-tRNA synthetase
VSSNIFEELKWRGLVFDHTEEVPELLAKEKISLYNGFDPTADSLHVGHLVPMIALARFQRFGHTPIAVAGGGTGMIGDPSGRSDERNLLGPEQIQYNVERIKTQLAQFLDFEVKSNPAKLVNNADWLAPLSMLDFLRDVGKSFSVNVMLSKDSVKSRLENGISYTEFSYMLLQSYDFLHLYRQHGCVLQTGGSDQWGNITAGSDLIRREGGRAHGLVYPLITKADGSKFGKTAAGAVWLAADRTSPYRFYQFWVNADDKDVVNYLKKFTWLPQEEVADLEAQHTAAPHERVAHKRLAQEMTRTLHGETALAKAEQASAVLFGGSLEGLSAGDIADIFAEVPSTEISRHEFDGGLNVVDLVAQAGISKSKGEARRDIQGGGVYLNNGRIDDVAQTVTAGDAIEGQFLLLRKGRKQYHLVKIVG